MNPTLLSFPYPLCSINHQLSFAFSPSWRICSVFSTVISFMLQLWLHLGMTLCRCATPKPAKPKGWRTAPSQHYGGSDLSNPASSVARQCLLQRVVGRAKWENAYKLFKIIYVKCLAENNTSTILSAVSIVIINNLHTPRVRLSLF